jgi:PKD repeat protein
MKTVLFKYWIILISMLSIANSSNLYAQLEAKHWYFGRYCGLKFENDTAIVLSNSQMITNRGSACMSDKSGNLLFYTDGFTIWNKNHDTLKNGFGLYSSRSSVQGAIIIPLPGNPNLYYLFTVSGTVRPNPGFWYHIVDMSKDNGNGEVVLKNQYICGNVTERLSATFHADKKSIWIMVHEWNSNKFKAYLLKNTGLDTNAIISPIGTAHTGHIANNMGQLKFSASGDKIACVIWDDGIVDIFDFNNSNGEISNCIAISFNKLKGAYGIEFSPNENFLYVSTGRPQGIYQIDLSSGRDSMIKKSGTYVYQDTTNPNKAWFYALQLGLDGKIYLARMYPELGCINNPNSKGTACNFVEKAITFTYATNMGLPTFLQSYFFLPDIEIENTCLGDSTSFTMRETSTIDSVLWNFGDSTFTWTNFSQSKFGKHVYADTGVYKVVAYVFHNYLIDTLEREFRISNYAFADFSIQDSSQCLIGNEFHFYDTSYSMDGSMTYEWDFGDSNKYFLHNPVKSYDFADTFPVSFTVTSSYGCETKIVKDVFVRPMPEAEILVNDSIQCLNENNFAFSTSDQLDNSWFFGDGVSSESDTSYHQYSVSDTFTVVLYCNTQFGCRDTATRKVVVKPSPIAKFSFNDSIQCFNEQLLDARNSSLVARDSIVENKWIVNSDTVC